MRVSGAGSPSPVVRSEYVSWHPPPHCPGSVSLRAALSCPPPCSPPVRPLQLAEVTSAMLPYFDKGFRYDVDVRMLLRSAADLEVELLEFKTRFGRPDPHPLFLAADGEWGNVFAAVAHSVQVRMCAYMCPRKDRVGVLAGVRMRGVLVWQAWGPGGGDV
jgi:hypothetical protein